MNNNSVCIRRGKVPVWNGHSWWSVDNGAEYPTFDGAVRCAERLAAIKDTPVVYVYQEVGGKRELVKAVFNSELNSDTLLTEIVDSYESHPERVSYMVQLARNVVR